MALGFSQEQIREKIFTGLKKPIPGYARGINELEMKRIADVIADVIAENNNRILLQLGIANVNIQDC